MTERRALVIFNPAAGRSRQRRLEAVLDGLPGLGWRP
ncbi:MAG: diacylglycerol kinase family lipid kinase, partial [Alphaproteobacteria bacterium]|nr:diacylglycerol kinase family lipid kinase [Alphaproteobacteria bacterium]